MRAGKYLRTMAPSVLAILLIILPVFGQKAELLRTGDLFDSDDITSGWVTLTNADTVLSNETLAKFYGGNVRVTVLFDTVSGSGNKAFLDYGIMDSDFKETGISNYTYTVIDSFQIADDHTKQTYQIDHSYSFLKDPVMAYQLRLRQTGTQVNKFKINIIPWKQ